MIDSTNTQPPDFGPGDPIYPELPQIVRVTSPPFTGPGRYSYYPCLVQQYNPPLSLRDREAAYVIEPNNVPLAPAYYDCRLIGSHLGLPLFAASCCLPGGFSSSSSSSR